MLTAEKRKSIRVANKYCAQSYINNPYPAVNKKAFDSAVMAVEEFCSARKEPLYSWHVFRGKHLVLCERLIKNNFSIENIKRDLFLEVWSKNSFLFDEETIRQCVDLAVETYVKNRDKNCKSHVVGQVKIRNWDIFLFDTNYFSIYSDYSEDKCDGLFIGVGKWKLSSSGENELIESDPKSSFFIWGVKDQEKAENEIKTLITEFIIKNNL